MSPLGDKLRAAGLRPTSERLTAIVAEVRAAHPKDYEAAAADLWSRVQGDAALLAEIYAPWQRDALRRVLAQAKPAREGADHEGAGNHCPSARPRNPAAGLDAVVAIKRQTILDTMVINGRPLGDCTAREAGEWAEKHALKARFVKAVIENLPPDDPIRRWRSAEEAKDIYARVMEAGDV